MSNRQYAIFYTKGFTVLRHIWMIKLLLYCYRFVYVYAVNTCLIINAKTFATQGLSYMKILKSSHQNSFKTIFVNPKPCISKYMYQIKDGHIFAAAMLPTCMFRWQHPYTNTHLMLLLVMNKKAFYPVYLLNRQWPVFCLAQVIPEPLLIYWLLIGS